MWDWDIVWRVLLLSIVFLADAIVFADLAKDELQNWRTKRLTRERRHLPAQAGSAAPLS
jgi:hypothetical protein